VGEPVPGVTTRPGPLRQLGRLLLDSILLLPRALRTLVAPGKRRGARAAAGLTVPLGALALLITLLATLNEVRVLFLYWLTDRGSYADPDTWGGPTLVGAWAVHAALGLLLLPVLLGLLVGLRRLAGLVERRLATGGGPIWLVSVTALVDVAVVVLLVAFVRQV
jgi:hypothetical protein